MTLMEYIIWMIFLEVLNIFLIGNKDFINETSLAQSVHKRSKIQIDRINYKDTGAECQEATNSVTV